MEYLVIFGLIVVLCVLFAWRVSAKGRVFVVRVRRGVPIVTRGTVTPAFVADLAEVLRQHGVRRGAVYGARRGGAVVIGFSPGFPQGARQKVRNVWSMHGR